MINLLVELLVKGNDWRKTYQLKSTSCQVLPGLMGLSDMTISQRRMVLATTGMTPIERMTARAAGTIVSNRLL
jgi:hypothetical protein